MGWNSYYIGGKIIVEPHQVHVCHKGISMHATITNYSKTFKSAYWSGDCVIVEYTDGTRARYSDSSGWSSC